MRRLLLVVITPLLLAQAPPMPPPSSGEIHCVMRGEHTGDFNVDGTLSYEQWFDDTGQPVGKFMTITLKSSNDSLIPSGRYSGSLGFGVGTRGIFNARIKDKGGDKLSEFDFLTDFKQGQPAKGVAMAQLIQGSSKAFYTGSCVENFGWRKKS